MGADSLVLIAATNRIEAEFGVKLPIRSFFEELQTPEALAAHLAELAPREPEPVAAAPAPVAGPAAPAGFLEEVIRNQIELMNRQLDMLQGREPSRPPVYAAGNAKPATPTRRVVPVSDGLSERQRSHLDNLIQTYTSRTAASKASANGSRAVMADSRGTAGFRFSIKEMLYPIVARSSSGARFEDLDGNSYIDISMGFGVHLFGHEPEFLHTALRESLSRGLRLGPQSDRAGDVAALLTRLSGQDRVAFCNTGSEAVMVALRLARTVTGRGKVVIFRGAYHGHFDGILAEGTGAPLVPGVAPGAVAETLVLEYGEPDSLERLKPMLGEVAAVVVEPVQSRRPDLHPEAFLKELRELTRQAGTALVFDEMITGFRIAAGGAQAHFGVKADLVTYGKILGGGLPIGAIAGRADLMAAVDGGIWTYGDESFPGAETTLFAGTFNKNALTMAAAHAVLTEIERRGPDLYRDLNERTERLVARLEQVLDGTPIHIARFGSMFRFVFARNLDPFFYHLLLRGIYIWEGRTCFLSAAHTDADVDAVVDAVAGTVADLREGGFLDPAPATVVSTSDAFPLTKAQRQLAALAAADPAGAAAYAVPIAIDLNGPVDHDRLALAVARVAARHDSLRAALDPDAGTQRIVADAEVRLQVRDIAEDELDGAMVLAIAQPFDLARPPLLRAFLSPRSGATSPRSSRRAIRRAGISFGVMTWVMSE
jgi:glutamate-1-semialdehyde aminotransferase